MRERTKIRESERRRDKKRRKSMRRGKKERKRERITCKIERKAIKIHISLLRFSLRFVRNEVLSPKASGNAYLSD